MTTAELDPEKRFIKWKVPLVETKTATVESEEKKIETPFPYAIRLKWRMPTTGKFRFDVEPTLGEGKKAEQELAIGEELFIKDKDGKDKGIGYKLSDKTPKEQDDYVIIEHIKSGRKWRVDRAKGIGSPPPPTRLKE
ncbi:MAG: hypothetical protein N2234_06155 [Planctomycetota bacterium]|nr:hypothetical protein [Planctomycetota bacterium]